MLYYALTRNLLSILLAKVKLKIQLSSTLRKNSVVLITIEKKKKNCFLLCFGKCIYI